MGVAAVMTSTLEPRTAALLAAGSIHLVMDKMAADKAAAEAKKAAEEKKEAEKK